MISIRWPDLWPVSSMVRPPRAALWPLRWFNHSGNSVSVTDRRGPSFRGAKRTRNLEIPDLVLTHHPGMTCPSGPYPRRYILLDAGLAFRRNGALVTLAFLQPGPICRDIGAKILGEPDIARQPQRIAVDDIGRGKPAGAQGFGIRGGCLDGAQPAEEPFGIIAGHLRVAAFFRLELAVSQHQRL